MVQVRVRKEEDDVILQVKKEMKTRGSYGFTGVHVGGNVKVILPQENRKVKYNSIAAMFPIQVRRILGNCWTLAP